MWDICLTGFAGEAPMFPRAGLCLQRSRAVGSAWAARGSSLRGALRLACGPGLRCAD